MPQEVVSRLFEHSFTGSGLGKCVGFGLSVAQSMIVASGGWIEVESVSGGGTQFEVICPGSSRRMLILKEPLGLCRSLAILTAMRQFF